MSVPVPVRAGSWMQTYTGRAFWPLDPRPEEIDPRDIAHALAHQCRYGGHCRTFYSVAEHAIYVSRHVPGGYALAGLLHDATEAYLVDVPRPVKRHLPEYQAIEERLYAVIAQRFGLPPKIPACVHAIDNRILLNERDQLMAPCPLDWEVPGDPLPGLVIQCYPADVAEYAFLRRLHALWSEVAA